MRLCAALHGAVVRFDGELIHVVGRVRVLKPIVPLIGRSAPSPMVSVPVHELAQDATLDQCVATAGEALAIGVGGGEGGADRLR